MTVLKLGDPKACLALVESRFRILCRLVDDGYIFAFEIACQKPLLSRPRMCRLESRISGLYGTFLIFANAPRLGHVRPSVYKVTRDASGGAAELQG